MVPAREQHHDAEHDRNQRQDHVELANRFTSVVRRFTSPVSGHSGPLGGRKHLPDILENILGLRGPGLCLFQLFCIDHEATTGNRRPKSTESIDPNAMG
jgi:hypothetical protein